MPDTIRFQWHHEWITDRLTMAIGSVILKWAMLDADFSRVCQTYWFKEHALTEPMPQSFKNRTRNLIPAIRKLYTNEPDEFRQFSWFIQRLRIANSERDDLAHGQYGKATVDGREFEGLLVHHPAAATRAVPMTVFDIEALGQEVQNLHTEMSQVSMALHVASQVAALRDIPNPPTLGGLLPSTTGPRSPMQPRWSLPPPTFRA
jgi:hypothetical protein